MKVLPSQNFAYINIKMWFLSLNMEKAMAPHSVLLPGESHGWRSLVGYSPWGHKELDTTERLHFTSLLLVTKSKKDPVISVQSLSYVRLCDPTDCTMPGLPVHHQLLELAQTQVH